LRHNLYEVNNYMYIYVGISWLNIVYCLEYTECRYHCRLVYVEPLWIAYTTNDDDRK